MSQPPPPRTPALPPAGWYPDPTTGQPRWWDGNAWTSHTPSPVPAAPRIPGELASFGIRAGAALLDVAIVLGLWLVVVLTLAGLGAILEPGALVAVATVVGILVVVAAGIVYAYVYPVTCGQTFGKHLCGIEIRRLDNGSNHLGPSVGIGREFLKGLASYTLFLMFLWVLWDEQRQGWHDKAVSTVVVRTDRRLPARDFFAAPFRR